MFTHIVIGSNDLGRSQKFYDAIFSATGAATGQIDAKGRVVYSRDGHRLLVTKPINGAPATFANGGTIGLAMADPAMVDAWHAAGIANGGATAEDPPGIRQVGARMAYIAYLRDPDGNKLCASCRVPD